ncbi:MAG: helix-turn-helix transcriptional regulator [Methanobacteriota archaeon]|nr:MAG: helix-turn-helix transcriptional regulator [Euryarchaeota archaeon]
MGGHSDARPPPRRLLHRLDAWRGRRAGQAGCGSVSGGGLLCPDGAPEHLRRGLPVRPGQPNPRLERRRAPEPSRGGVHGREGEQEAIGFFYRKIEAAYRRRGSLPRARATCPGRAGEGARLGGGSRRLHAAASWTGRNRIQTSLTCRALDNIPRGNIRVSPQRLGTVIRKLREEQRMTQEQLARKSSVTQGYIAKLELGMKKNPSLPTIKKLARALGVPVTELLE